MTKKKLNETYMRSLSVYSEGRLTNLQDVCYKCIVHTPLQESVRANAQCISVLSKPRDELIEDGITLGLYHSYKVNMKMISGHLLTVLRHMNHLKLLCKNNMGRAILLSHQNYLYKR